MPLCLNLFPWTRFRRSKEVVNLRMALDHGGYRPTLFVLPGQKGGKRFKAI